jgi:hypothetical protein
MQHNTYPGLNLKYGRSSVEHAFLLLQGFSRTPNMGYLELPSELLSFVLSLSMVW